MSLLDNKRVRELVSSAEGARRLAESLQGRGKDPVDVLETLEELHKELGELVHTWAAAQLEASAAEARPASEEEETLRLEAMEAPEEADTGFFHADFQEGELEEDLPYEDTEDTDEVDAASVHGLASSRPAPTRTSTDEEYPAWLLSLDQLMISLAMPTDPESPVELAAEAARVQLATCDLAARWSDYPEPLQLALLGLLSCRARHLSGRLQVDVGPRLALDRMKRYRKAAGLPPVVGLISSQQPESGSWTRDAMHWWEVLVEGLQPLQQQHSNGGIPT